MKGRKLPLGGSSRSRRSQSEDQSHSPQNTDTPAGRTRLRSPSLSTSSPLEPSSQHKTGAASPRTKQPKLKTEASGSKRSSAKTRKGLELEGSPPLQKPETEGVKEPASASKTATKTASRRIKTSSNRDDAASPQTPNMKKSLASNGKPKEGGAKTAVDSPEDSAIMNHRRFFPPGEMPALIAVEIGRDNMTTVRLSLNGALYVPPSPPHDSYTTSSNAEFLGHDGNQYYCQVCHQFGNVVCCDGCPRVYHQECIPLETPARITLENDEDPWFCSHCLDNKKPGASSKSGKSPVRSSKRNDKSDRRFTSQNRCVDCGKDDTNLPVEPCSGCGNYVHHPSCIDDQVPSSKVFCSTCQAVEDLTKEEDDMHEITERSITEQGKRSRSSRAAKDKRESSRRVDDEGSFDDEEEGDDDDEADQTKTDRRKRSRSGSVSEKKKKKKKKRKKLKSSQTPTVEVDVDEVDDSYLPQDDNSDHVRAIPAFYFYLGENRWKIERVLARKHRYFNRLPKGRERNELVAKEAAMWWVKLRPTDHRRYMTMSMRDLESRIIQWKEEKNLREMLSGPASVMDTESLNITHSPQRLSQEDDSRALERHEKRFRGTSVGSKPFKPEPGHSYNRVLLDLLHDMRFHPCPMVAVDRPEGSTDVDDHSSRATIPFFEVHGPVSTSVGDECMGCSRGWRHFCPILKRPLPSVEHRAKLQPPLSSLMATRIGLGLRPRLERVDEAEKMSVPVKKKDENAPVLAWRPAEEAAAVKELPVVPSSSLQDVSDRFDDIVLVIEETTAMRVKEPPAPDGTDSGQSEKLNVSRSLPTQRTKDDLSQSKWHKCGRCRTVSESDMGCIQCRRAQLVINMTKKQPHANDSSKHDGKALKVQTVMLGRVQMKEGSGEAQTPGDQAVCNAILKQRWTPIAVLPPRKQVAPSSSRPPTIDDVEEIEEEREAEEEKRESDSMNVSGEEASAMEVEAASMEDDKDETSKEETTPVSARQQDRSRTRQRPTRLLVSSASTKDYNGTDRLKETERQQKLDALTLKCVSIACYGILLAVFRHDPLKLFATPVTDDDYNESVKNPIDLGAIREKVLGNKYTTVNAIFADLRLLCDNSLSYYPSHSVNWKTAKDIGDQTIKLETKAYEWISAVNNAYETFLLRRDQSDDPAGSKELDTEEDAFVELRKEWPEAVEMLEKGDDLRNQIDTDLIRTKENETAYYGTLAIRRAAAAASNSLAPYTDSNDAFSLVVKRNCENDEALRDTIDSEVASLTDPVELRQVSSWREESIVRLLRKVQSRRMERRSISEHGCSRCIELDGNTGTAIDDEMFHSERRRKRADDLSKRVDPSRASLKTGLGSAKVCQDILKRSEEGTEKALDTVKDSCVSVRASRIHGLGLFADQPFKKGDVVAEYVGEYINDEVADAREKRYREERRQDYIFRINEKLAIDATMKGGPARFINHNCEPNCYSHFIPGPKGKKHLQRVMIMAQHDIEINREITFDYRIPLELDLSARVPCNCQADACRGFMNWDLPETGSNNRALLVHKRGANMRDRIRRLRRPLKRDESSYS